MESQSAQTPFQDRRKKEPKFKALTRVLPFVVLVLALALATMSLITAQTASEQATRANNAAEQRAEIFEIIELQGRKQLCFGRLQGAFDVAISDGVLSAEGSPERAAAVARLDYISSILREIEDVCFTDNPNTNPVPRAE